MSLYGDGARALRQVLLVDERVRNTAVDLARMSQQIADLRDRVSRLEGMLVAGVALSRESGAARDRRRLPQPNDHGAEPGRLGVCECKLYRERS